MDKLKENALQDFVKMIKQSWTYTRLTTDEKNNLENVIAQINYCGNIKGSYKDRYNILQVMYSSFLAALDYNKNPVSWREKDPETVTF